MKLEIILELSEKSLRWCGVSFRVAWNLKEKRSMHSFDSFVAIKRKIKNSESVA